jgi:hypothetical protein
MAEKIHSATKMDRTQRIMRDLAAFLEQLLIDSDQHIMH